MVCKEMQSGILNRNYYVYNLVHFTLFNFIKFTTSFFGVSLLKRKKDCFQNGVKSLRFVGKIKNFARKKKKLFLQNTYL